MNKLLMLSPILLAFCYNHMTHAAEPFESSATYTNHFIVNNRIEGGEWVVANYQFTEPAGIVHKGYLYPGKTTTFNFDSNKLPSQSKISGTYLLQYSYCPSFYWTCRSYSTSLFIKNNADVIWEMTSDGIKVTQTDL